MFDENETAEQIRAKRNRLKHDYKDFYNSVSEILFRHDPIDINFETNTDEYEPEVDTILPRLKNCNSVDDVVTVVYEEFQKWFGVESAGERSRYKEIAREIWNLWQNKKNNLK